MGHLFHIVWWIFKRASGKVAEMDHFEYLYIFLFRQINIDYSICEALKRFPNCRAALIIYDICCQWCKHFRERVSESEFLEIWEGIEITPAVGKWHLAAHIRECFCKFSLNFVEGAAEVEGEILETLWSGLDEIAGLTQGMSISHRQEVLDDYINDSNWKKLLRIRTYTIQIDWRDRIHYPSS
jgi:Kyakuja-Dileera-Zisupton transposase